MKANETLSAQDWAKVALNCNSITSEYLILGINAYRQQQRKDIITAEAARHLSRKLLVEIVMKCIYETNTCEMTLNGTVVWIDSKGEYVISTR